MSILILHLRRPGLVYWRLDEITYTAANKKKVSFSEVNATRSNISFAEYDQYATLRVKTETTLRSANSPGGYWRTHIPNSQFVGYSWLILSHQLHHSFPLGKAPPSRIVRWWGSSSRESPMRASLSRVTLCYYVQALARLFRHPSGQRGSTERKAKNRKDILQSDNRTHFTYIQFKFRLGDTTVHFPFTLEVTSTYVFHQAPSLINPSKGYWWLQMRSFRITSGEILANAS